MGRKILGAKINEPGQAHIGHPTINESSSTLSRFPSPLTINTSVGPVWDELRCQGINLRIEQSNSAFILASLCLQNK